MPTSSTISSEHVEHRLTLDELLNNLTEDGVLSSEIAENVRNRARLKTGSPDIHPLVLIVEQKPHRADAGDKLLTLEQLIEWLAGRSGLDYKRIDPLKINVPAVTDVVSYAYAARHRILPIEVKPNQVIIATSEPYLSAWVPELSRILQKEIVRVISNPLDIERYRVEFFGVSRSVKQAADTSGEGYININNLEQLVELGKSGTLDANDQHIVHIVDWLLQYAFEQRASDIHIEPRRDVGNVRFRIDGVMQQVYQIPVSITSAVTSRLKILGRMDVAEKRRPQDGRIKTRTSDDKEIEMRLSTMPTAFGEKLVLRIFDPDVLVRSFRDLGFSEEDAGRWQDMVSRPNGIILVTGPTGSGKTTTLYSTLKQLATEEVNVCTVEEPIEMVEPSFNQMQVQHNIDLDFASGIRTLMRQDPDIIMVGEIRDLETAEMAIQAALTGHLVLSTLHTNDAASAITRLLDIGVPHYLIKATLIGVVAQRLVRTLCPHCKQSHDIDSDQWQSLVKPWKVPQPSKVFSPVGCLECRNTGYFGRVGLYEILMLSEGVQKLINEQTDATAVRRFAYKEGMRPLRISGAYKIHTGQTTMDEVFRVAPAEID